MGKTERLAQEQSRDDAAQLRLIVDNMPAMSIAYDTNLRCLFANRRFAEFFGFAGDSIVGKHLREIIGEGPYREVKPYFETALDGHCATYRRTCILDGGEPRYVEANLVPHIGEDGRTLGLVAVATDVTEGKGREAALRAQEEFFRLIAENIGDFIAILDLNGRRLYNSPSYRRLFGGATDLGGTNSFAEVHPEDRQRVKRVFRKTVQSGIGHQIEYRFVAEDGEIRHMESRGGVIRDNEGHVARVVVVSHDITERKRAEERIQRMAYHDSLTGLPNRVLFNDRLNQAIRLAKRDSSQFALLFLDLDRFKPVNDTLGHAAGDELLQEVAARIRRQVRDSDTVARIGGDEFSVILHDIAKREEAEIVARKIVTALAAPFQLGRPKHGTDIGTSIGIAIYPVDGRDAQALVKAADATMYRAKQEGCSFHFCAP